jgi:Sulfotransferase domain
MVEVIGAGVGRTGTYSLKLALEQLGFGPCHHMEEVLKDPERQIPVWSAAARGTVDWQSILTGYRSAVDWPTAAFWRELADACPEAKVILTTRGAESWCDSYLETIHAFMSKRGEAPPHVQPWFEMAFAVVAKSGFAGKTRRVDIIRAFEAHVDAVTGAIAAERLLVYEVKDGWKPLCAFLGKPPPAAPFPKTNNRDEFWELARIATG